MSIRSHIRESMQGVIEYYSQNTGQAIAQDKEAVGGGASAPSSGRMMRAALANY